MNTIRVWLTINLFTDLPPEADAFEGESPTDVHTVHPVNTMRGKLVFVRASPDQPWMRGRVETWEEEAGRLRALLDVHHMKTLGLHSAGTSALLDRVNELNALRSDIQRTANALFGLGDSLQTSYLDTHIEKLNGVSKSIGAVSDWLLAYVPPTPTEGT
jgi:hypothetical protein